MALTIVALAGDGIGPEVVDAALRVPVVALNAGKATRDIGDELLTGAMTDAIIAQFRAR